MRRATRLVFGVTAVGLAAGAVAAPRAHAAAECTQATNIEAIIDDSGSMAITDQNLLRVQAMDLLINALGSNTTLGAIEFGSGEDFTTPPTPAADAVFNPEPV